MQTPRFCGHDSSAGAVLRAFTGERGLRMSWLIVGILASRPTERLEIPWSISQRKQSHDINEAAPSAPLQGPQARLPCRGTRKHAAFMRPAMSSLDAGIPTEFRSRNSLAKHAQATDVSDSRRQWRAYDSRKDSRQARNRRKSRCFTGFEPV
ncbi:hypothetical protein BOSEA31B_14630 [Hyphomicrobiales bacterium]|nr:hypothetical protein BOSEA31B_14630 [Hyphomicrobiales bacterium]